MSDPTPAIYINEKAATLAAREWCTHPDIRKAVVLPHTGPRGDLRGWRVMLHMKDRSQQPRNISNGDLEQ